jgi:hypothetical protein
LSKKDKKNRIQPRMKKPSIDLEVKTIPYKFTVSFFLFSCD